MNFREYQQAAARTAMKQGTDYFAIGLAGETGEVLELVKKHFYHGKPLDRTRLKEEIGDVLWYAANLARINGIDFEDVATSNIEKLKERHPNGFNRATDVLRSSEKGFDNG